MWSTWLWKDFWHGSILRLFFSNLNIGYTAQRSYILRRCIHACLTNKYTHTHTQADSEIDKQTKRCRLTGRESGGEREREKRQRSGSCNWLRQSRRIKGHVVIHFITQNSLLLWSDDPLFHRDPRRFRCSSTSVYQGRSIAFNTVIESAWRTACYPRRCRSAWVGFSSSSVCLFVRSRSQKRMIRTCSNLVQGMTLGYPRSVIVLGLKGRRSRSQFQ